MAMALVSRMAEAYWAPRRSIRRLLSAEPTLWDGVYLALTGLVLGMALTLGVEIVLGRSVGEVVLQWVVEQMPTPPPQPLVAPETSFEVVLMVIGRGMGLFALIVVLAVAIGRGAGGVGGAASVASAVGWWYLATAPASLAQSLMILLASPESRGAVAMGLTAIFLFQGYQLAAFLAEAHGFRSARLVLMVMFVVFAGLTLLLAPFVGQLGVGGSQ